MRKRVIVGAMLLLLTGVVLYTPELASAQQDPLGLAPGRATGLKDQDVRVTVATIINKGLLPLLGTIMVALIVYAGILWTTAAGNDDQIGKAKSIIISSVIGLIIILSAYSITTYVTRQAYEATTGDYQDAPQ